MAQNPSVSLGNHFDEFIATQPERGRYSAASAVGRAGARLLETEKEELAARRRLIEKGRGSGAADHSYESFISAPDLGLG